MAFTIVLFFIILWISEANKTSQADLKKMTRQLMDIKYPFNTGKRIEAARNLEKKINERDSSCFDSDEYLKGIFDIIANPKSKETYPADELDMFHEELLQYLCHMNECAYSPDGMDSSDFWCIYPEYGAFRFDDTKSYLDYVRRWRLMKRPMPKHPQVLEKEKQWLREWQRSDRVIELWEEKCIWENIIIPYRYNSEDMPLLRKRWREERRKRRQEKREYSKKALQEYWDRYRNTPDL